MLIFNSYVGLPEGKNKNINNYDDFPDHPTITGNRYPSSTVQGPDAPWCWNIYLHLPQKWHRFVGKYSSTMVRIWGWLSWFITPMSLWFMVLICTYNELVNGVYKPSNITKRWLSFSPINEETFTSEVWGPHPMATRCGPQVMLLHLQPP